MSDFTILIQGPINKTSIEGISDYEKYGEVVLTTWEAPEQEPLFESIPDHIRTSAFPLPSMAHTKGVLLESTFYYAVSSMYNGLNLVDTEYVIKTRSDERYLNLQPFIGAILKDPHKFVCGNIFFHPGTLHIGDHLFATRTDTLKRAISTLKNMYDTGTNEHDWAIQGPNEAERVLAHAWLNARGVPREEWAYLHTFENNFDVIDINETDKFTARYEHGHLTYSSTLQNWDNRPDHRTTGPNKISPSCKCPQCQSEKEAHQEAVDD